MVTKYMRNCAYLSLRGKIDKCAGYPVLSVDTRPNYGQSKVAYV
jgi:hypothetical protein